MYQYTNTCMKKKPVLYIGIILIIILIIIHWLTYLGIYRYILLGLYNSCLVFLKGFHTYNTCTNIKRLKIWSSKHDSRPNDNIPLIYLAWKYDECLGETSINKCYNEMNCVIKRKYWEKIYGCFILMKYVNKILVEEKCYSCEEKNHEQNNAYQ